MKYTEFDPLVRAQCKKMKVLKDLAGGLVKAGTTVYTYHKFRFFVPDTDPESYTQSGEPTRAQRFDIDPSFYGSYFAPVKEKDSTPEPTQEKSSGPEPVQSKTGS